MSVSHPLCRIWLIDTSSSSAAIISRPVMMPWPSSIWLVLIVTVLSAPTETHESTNVLSGS